MNTREKLAFRSLSYCFVIAFTVVAFYVDGADIPTIGLDELRQCVQAYYDSIDSLQTDMTVHVQPIIRDGVSVDGEPYLSEVRQMKIKGPRKIMFDLHGYYPTGELMGHAVHAIDGQYHKALNLRESEQERKMDHNPLFANVREVNYKDALNPLHTILAMMGRYLGHFENAVDALAPEEDIQLRSESVDGREMIVADVKVHPNKRQVYWFDIERNFAMYRFERYTRRGLVRILQNTAFQYFENAGVWIPTDSVVTEMIRRTVQGDPSVIDTHYDALIHCANIVVNEPLDDSVFELDFPLGTRVWSNLEEQGYWVGGSDLRKHAREIERDMKVPVTILIGVVLVLFSFMLFLRHVRRKGQP